MLISRYIINKTRVRTTYCLNWYNPNIRPHSYGNGSNSFSIGDHYSVLGYGSFPTVEITQKPIFNQSSLLKLPKWHTKLKC